MNDRPITPRPGHSTSTPPHEASVDARLTAGASADVVPPPIPALRPIPLLAGLGDAGVLYARPVLDPRTGRIAPIDAPTADALRAMSLDELRELVQCGREFVYVWLRETDVVLTALMHRLGTKFTGRGWTDPGKPHPDVARGVRLYTYRANCPMSLRAAWRTRYGWDVVVSSPKPTSASQRVGAMLECRSLLEAEILAGVRTLDGELRPEFRWADAKAGVGGVA